MTQCPQCGQKTMGPNGVCSACGYAEGGRVADSFLGRTVGGDFYIRSPLGEGGFAKVYLADQHSLRRRAVVKILKPGLAQNAQVVERFRLEAQLAAKLAHAGIAQIFATGETDEGLPFFAMEYIAGRPLSKILKSEGGLEMKRAARLLCLIAEAVDQAHENGVIHRDLKPDNVMVVPRNPLPGDPPGSHEIIKILDFGIAKEESSQDRGMTKTGEVFGTPYYMSPEQCNGEKVTRGTDLYSLGVMAFEMFVGKVPFTGASAGSILLQHITVPPPRLEDIAQKKFPAILEAVIARALSKHPAQRHSSAKEFAAAVAQAVDAIPTFQLPQHSVPPPPPPSYNITGAVSSANLKDTRPSGKQDGQSDRSVNRAPLLIGTGIAVLAILSVFTFIGKQNQVELPPVNATQPASEPVKPASMKFVPSEPKPDATLPEGASLAKVPPLPSKRAGAKKPDTRKMVDIPAGPFPMGPEGIEVRVGAFSIDVYEVTVDEYALCVSKKKCRAPQQYLGFRGPKMPVVGVSFEDAKAFCAFQGKRLPTEAEWEKAARGTDGRRYPWGEGISCDRANYGGSTLAKSCRGVNPAHTAEVGSFPEGASPYGVQDLAGNAWEWVLDAYEKDHKPKKGIDDPRGPELAAEAARVVRGGGWRDEAEEVSALARKAAPPDIASPEIGFRCVREKK